MLNSYQAPTTTCVYTVQVLPGRQRLYKWVIPLELLNKWISKTHQWSGEHFFSAVQFHHCRFVMFLFRPSGGNISELFQSGQNASYWYGTFGRPGVFEVKLGVSQLPVVLKMTVGDTRFFGTKCPSKLGWCFQKIRWEFWKNRTRWAKKTILTANAQIFLTHKFTNHWWRSHRKKL